MSRSDPFKSGFFRIPWIHLPMLFYLFLIFLKNFYSQFLRLNQGFFDFSKNFWKKLKKSVDKIKLLCYNVIVVDTRQQHKKKSKSKKGRLKKMRILVHGVKNTNTNKIYNVGTNASKANEKLAELQKANPNDNFSIVYKFKNI